MKKIIITIYLMLILSAIGYAVYQSYQYGKNMPGHIMGNVFFAIFAALFLTCGMVAIILDKNTDPLIDLDSDNDAERYTNN